MIGEELRAEIEKPARKKGVAPIQQMLALLASLALIWFVFRNGTGDATPVADGAPSPRVASTSPAITDSLVELGLAAHVVGRSGFCTSVPKTVPVIGDLRDFDAERLAIARPDVLFVQPPIAGTAPELRDFCTQKSIRLIERRLDKGKAVVLCSHGPVIPQLVAEVVAQTHGDVDATIRRAASPSTGDFSVFHIARTANGNHIVSVEYHEAP